MTSQSPTDFFSVSGPVFLPIVFTAISVVLVWLKKVLSFLPAFSHARTASSLRPYTRSWRSTEGATASDQDRRLDLEQIVLAQLLLIFLQCPRLLITILILFLRSYFLQNPHKIARRKRKNWTLLSSLLIFEYSPTHLLSSTSPKEEAICSLIEWEERVSPQRMATSRSAIFLKIIL